MNKILRPMGKPVKRITVDLDALGHVQINGQGQGPGNVVVPLQMFDVCMILANVVSNSLMAMAGKIPLTMKHEATPGGEGAESDKTETEN